MLTFHFNKDAWDAFAKELRRASWGVAAFGAGVGLQAGSGITALLGCSLWAALQILAVVVQSITVKQIKR